jgi:drug/metabolite transporter (DMT)-like permease
MQFTRRRVADAGLLVLVNAMWLLNTAYKTATSQAGPVTVACGRFLTALVLIPFSSERRGMRSAPPMEWRRFVLLAVLGLIPGSAVLAWGTELSTASNAALLYLTLPVITAVMAVTLLGEKMSLVRWGSLGLALIGVLIVSGPDRHSASLHSMKFLGGNLIILVAVTGSAFYNVYSKRPRLPYAPRFWFWVHGCRRTLCALVLGMERHSLEAVRVQFWRGFHSWCSAFEPAGDGS